jgi:hypothetical protein
MLLELRILLWEWQCRDTLVGNWEIIRSSQESREIGIKTNIYLNTHMKFQFVPHRERLCFYYEHHSSQKLTFERFVVTHFEIRVYWCIGVINAGYENNGCLL